MPQQSPSLDPLPSRAMRCVPLVGAPLSTETAELLPDDLADVAALASLRALA